MSAGTELSCMYCHCYVYDTYVVFSWNVAHTAYYSSRPLWSGGDKFYNFYRYRRFIVYRTTSSYIPINSNILDSTNVSTAELIEFIRPNSVVLFVVFVWLFHMFSLTITVNTPFGL
jgi:hypothetical protein